MTCFISTRFITDGSWCLQGSSGTKQTKFGHASVFPRMTRLQNQPLLCTFILPSYGPMQNCPLCITREREEVVGALTRYIWATCRLYHLTSRSPQRPLFCGTPLFGVSHNQGTIHFYLMLPLQLCIVCVLISASASQHLLPPSHLPK